MLAYFHYYSNKTKNTETQIKECQEKINNLCAEKQKLTGTQSRKHREFHQTQTPWASHPVT